MGAKVVAAWRGPAAEGKPERRGAGQYPLSLGVQFVIDSPRPAAGGTGRTVLMSSREIVFTTNRTLRPGTKLQLAIAWPAMLADNVGLQLMVRGRVLHAENECITMSIAKYEFRTRSAEKVTEIRNAYAC